MNRDKYIEEQMEAFRVNLEESLDLAKDPEALKWAIFSTGSKEVEEGVLDKMVDIFLPNVSGVFIFRPQDARHCVSLLKEATAKLEKELVKMSLANEDEYVMKFGVDNGE